MFIVCVFVFVARARVCVSETPHRRFLRMERDDLASRRLYVCVFRAERDPILFLYCWLLTTPEHLGCN